MINIGPIELIVLIGILLLILILIGLAVLVIYFFLRSGSQGARQAEGTAGEQRVPCPYCAEMIMPGAKVCRFCGRDLPEKL